MAYQLVFAIHGGRVSSLGLGGAVSRYIAVKSHLKDQFVVQLL
jgi:hypothetical protein